MPLSKNEAWFPAKTHGWGWGLPRRWQGWVVMFAFVTALAAGGPLMEKGAIFYVAYSFLLGAALVAIALWKGEKPHWSWKKSE